MSLNTQNKFRAIFSRVIPVILGCLLGLIIFTFFNTSETAYSEYTPGKSLNWADVFGVGKDGQNLYFMVESKMNDVPEDRAIVDMANNFGFTRTEAEAVRDGSLIPFLQRNNLDGSVTQEQLVSYVENFIDDYEFLKELYSIRAEVDLTITPGEIFANGDLSDSSFDLIYDLELIEKVLFDKVSERTVYNSTNRTSENGNDNTAANNGNDNSGSGNTEGNSANGGTNSNGGNSSANSDEITNGDVETITIGDQEIEAEILEDDICLLPDIEDNSGENTNVPTQEEPTSKPITDLEYAEIDSDLEYGGNFENQYEYERELKDIFDEEGNLVPAKADKWRQVWCPSIIGTTPSDNNFGNVGFSSLGDLDGQLAGTFEGLTNFYGQKLSEELLELHVALCFNTEIITDKMDLFKQLDSSCILCEVEQINEIFDDLLSHSLIPNKVTGNAFESTKCKTAYSTPVVDINFITVAAPLPTKLNDDLIYDRNIFDEFKAYVDIYKPILFSEIEFSKQVDVATTALPSGKTQSDLLTEANKEFNKFKAQTLNELTVSIESEDMVNLNLYMKTLASEVRRMTAYFEAYENEFSEMAQICGDTRNKGYIN